MSPYKNQSFFKITIRFGVIFLIIVTLIKIVISIFKNGGISGMVVQYFSADTWQQFAKLQLLMSAFYGVFMAGYYKFIKK